MIDENNNYGHAMHKTSKDKVSVGTSIGYSGFSQTPSFSSSVDREKDCLCDLCHNSDCPRKRGTHGFSSSWGNSR